MVVPMPCSPLPWTIARRSAVLTSSNARRQVADEIGVLLATLEGSQDGDSDRASDLTVSMPAHPVGYRC